MSINSFLFISLALIGLFLWTACASDPFTPTKYHTEKTVTGVGSSSLDIQVTGTACATDLNEALRAANKMARYNLRTVVGNERYSAKLREIDRFEKDGQLCITMEASPR